MSALAFTNAHAGASLAFFTLSFPFPWLFLYTPSFRRRMPSLIVGKPGCVFPACLKALLYSEISLQFCDGEYELAGILKAGFAFLAVH